MARLAFLLPPLLLLSAACGGRHRLPNGPPPEYEEPADPFAPDAAAPAVSGSTPSSTPSAPPTPAP